ncbi:MAG TPA: hypothetical protein DHW42_05690 [Candidatus Marinimicrobia bacterium]|nr:hypothetical protein [Candidatus Neomarinimicrobiota bacterium]
MQKIIIDLTHKLCTGMPVYAGDKPDPEIMSSQSKLSWDITISSIRLGSHFGTHMDAPRHFFPKGKGLLDFPLSRFIGSALCLNKKDHFPGAIELDDEERFVLDRAKPTWVLVYTGFDQNWGKENYFINHPYLSGSLAEFLLEINVSGVGVDFPSIDAANAQKFNYPVHHLLLGAGLLAIENLTSLGKLPTLQLFELCALPLKTDTEGAPTRVVAVL